MMGVRTAIWKFMVFFDLVEPVERMIIWAVSKLGHKDD
jgi:hypothetical protein